MKKLEWQERIKPTPPVTVHDGALMPPYVGCPNCRMELDRSWKFCPYCGQSIRWEK